MGVGHRPGSTGRRDGGQPQTAQGSGLEAIAQYGRGEKDEATGLYDWYDLPPGVAEPQTGDGDGGIRVLELVGEWELVVADFASEYGIRLATADLTWREFLAYLAGLLSVDSRLRRRFAPEDEKRQEVPGGWW